MVNITAAVVNNSPKGIRLPASSRNAGSVRRGRAAANHHSRASGANTPAHSYQAHIETKKNVRDSRHSRAAPCTGAKSNRAGRPIIAPSTGWVTARVCLAPPDQLHAADEQQAVDGHLRMHGRGQGKPREGAQRPAG